MGTADEETEGCHPPADPQRRLHSEIAWALGKAAPDKADAVLPVVDAWVAAHTAEQGTGRIGEYFGQGRIAPDHHTAEAAVARVRALCDARGVYGGSLTTVEVRAALDPPTGQT